jgi:hypothetical protein
MSTDVNDSIQEEGTCKKTKIINFTILLKLQVEGKQIPQ